MIISLHVSLFRTRKSLFVHSALMLLKEMTNCQSKISLCKSVSELRSHICDGKIRKMYTASDLVLNVFCMFLFQLRAALFDIHDIFFTMTLEERLSLLHQDRDLRSERKLREMVTINAFWLHLHWFISFLF